MNGLVVAINMLGNEIAALNAELAKRDDELQRVHDRIREVTKERDDLQAKMNAGPMATGSEPMVRSG